MPLNDRARKSINQDLKKVCAEIRKKEMARGRLDRDIEKLRQEAKELDQSLED